MTGAFLAGVLAGLGVALPLGAIGVLIVREGVERGFGAASAAATGVAVVDAAYAAAAVVLGSALAERLQPYQRAVELIGAAVLLIVVGVGLRRLSRPDSGEAAAEVPRHRILAKFIGLTAVNPLTGIYFVVLATGLADRLTGPRERVLFVLGVGLASWAWQLVLAAAGAFAGGRLSERARIAVSLVGYGIVTVYAFRLAAGG